MLPACPLLVLELLAADPAPRAAPPDAAAVLAAMKEAAAKLGRVRALVRCEERVDAKTRAVRIVECWIDVPSGRVRTEVREHGRASPKLVCVAGKDGLRVHQLEVDEIAGHRLPLDLPTALAASFAGELLSTGFRGELGTFKPAAYGRPELGRSGEPVEGIACTRVTFRGNAQADLWIADGDRLPRRIRGPIPGATLEETIVELETSADFRHVAFELPVPEGRRIPDLAEVRARWAKPPPELERWPQPEEDAPDFAALDLDATTHRLSETAEHDALIAFWFDEDGRSAAMAAQAEEAWREAGSSLIFLHVAAGDRREPVARAVEAHGLRQPVWVAGSHPGDAFRLWRIWTCPVFARLSDLQVVAVTSDLAEVRRWLQ